MIDSISFFLPGHQQLLPVHQTAGFGSSAHVQQIRSARLAAHLHGQGRTGQPCVSVYATCQWMLANYDKVITNKPLMFYRIFVCVYIDVC